jgi:hypothetical protein
VLGTWVEPQQLFVGNSVCASFFSFFFPRNGYLL